MKFVSKIIYLYLNIESQIRISIFQSDKWNKKVQFHYHNEKCKMLRLNTIIQIVCVEFKNHRLR